MRPESDDEVAVGALASERMEIVLPGIRRMAVDRTVNGSALARVITVLEGRCSRFRAVCGRCWSWRPA